MEEQQKRSEMSVEKQFRGESSLPESKLGVQLTAPQLERESARRKACSRLKASVEGLY